MIESVVAHELIIVTFRNVTFVLPFVGSFKERPRLLTADSNKKGKEHIN